ncbi:UDP-N-acetylmuramoyl-tripeptide--D-alanyl-D-alanine ligase [Candidatus Profftia sp. (ex Adelges kitamiensis)]|uniref:UDP-N-acetylmuramoyl-tripeptide--D-alanyl-D- alanine ligase n=1 Tax=Candidatus Profftia sp. (ex Adelges kitamiensis) TaxID=2864218 RepID=UPI001CE2ACAE|nr:UDP-N-acetylmuramoyl-tripeptide--D-alanyl-D-alanine ligase [Candidatus Profftia sp. (ex Adelges kitamiensis)]
MISVFLQVISQVVNGRLIGMDIQVCNIAIDTRKITNQCMFIALKGKKIDAHNFAIDALESGAVALLVSQYLPINIPQVVVSDTRIALGLLGAWVRQQISARIIALTGSSGKTSVKEISATILKNCGNVLYTEGNYNNDIGVPLTLSLLQHKHEFAVIELGASHIGDIAYTSNLVKPDSVLINNLAAAHLDGLGSLLGVSRAKGEIFNNLSSDSTIIINADSNDWLHWCKKVTYQRVWRFSLQENTSADFFADDIHITQQGTQFKLHTPFGNITIVLSLPGYHNIANVLAAAALTMSVGAKLENVYQGLCLLKAIPGRLFPILLNKHQLIIDDTYNANVGSMIAAIQVLSTKRGYRIMVVGEMEELGIAGAAYHCQVGMFARKAGIDKVFSVGGLSYLISKESGCGEHFQNKASLIERLKKLLREYIEITILVKGSRNTAMEQVVRDLST